MLDSFLTFINQHTPDLKQQPTLLAVSGGMDSLAMAHLFHSQGLPAGIAHCNFGLRGAESDGDEAFVRDLASRFGFPFFVFHPDVKGLSAQASISTQMAARTLRYEWFETLRVQHGYCWIATAHHANDSLETLLLNLTRGTGLAGLTGIAPVQGNIIRPLIHTSRSEIAAYVSSQAIAWREDRTNATEDYSRNKVRHRVVPVLSELNPSLEKTFSASAERLRAADALLDGFLASWKAGAVRVDGDVVRIARREILDQAEPLYRLWYVLQDYGFSYNQMRSVLRALESIPGKRFFSATHALLLDREELILQTIAVEQAPDSLFIDAPEGTFHWQHLTLRISAGALDKTGIAVDADLLVFPLELRWWRPGDTFQPVGMRGRSKKVSDLLIDLKIDRFEKARTAVLVNGDGDIVWVVGIRADERFKVTEATRNTLLLSLG